MTLEQVWMKAYTDLKSTTGVIVALAVVVTFLLARMTCNPKAKTEPLTNGSPNNPYPLYTGPGLALSNVYGTARSDPGFDTGLHGGVGAAEPFRGRDNRPFKHSPFLNGRGPLDMWAGNQYLQAYYEHEVANPGEAGGSTAAVPTTGSIEAANAAVSAFRGGAAGASAEHNLQSILMGVS